ncbi:MAG: hypothetical protein C6W55_08465 [Thermobacillus sp.]|uniref:NADH dehydrogenase, FAD-containing subunit n=1 Tax=Thermobacillus composti (strain DSM 18247 / JCM 13945 / KWC4) TaxID=717605 RepID=L0EA72_THECK|nr:MULTISPECIES: hypothetical protein [Thermobacillus]AGA56591.1 hypothetical protein Theco_0366 [Thermobacillus composti KWC4]REK55934.1 MAG: hypothetical protein C6W55_08465 [Thermobacillus sp.]
MAEPKKIVVLGAGYAGIPAVLTLQKSLRDGEADITLINRCRVSSEMEVMFDYRRIRRGHGKSGRCKVKWEGGRG